MGAIEDYASLIDAVDSQKDRLHGPSGEDVWGGVNAKRFRHDPNRQMEDNFEIVAEFVKPDDVFVDAGGGAGRIGLPMALRCQEVINVEPSAGMCQEFMESAEEAGIKNSSNVHANWLDSHGIAGDVVHSANVTYFVRDIGLFVERLVASARRRVILSSYSVPNPMHNATLFKMVYGEDQATVPGYTHLLPVLWEMDILPDVRFLPQGIHFGGTEQVPSFPKTKEAAVEMSLAGIWLAPQHKNRAEVVVRDQFDSLFEELTEGFRPLWLPEARQVLITWETSKTR